MGQSTPPKFGLGVGDLLSALGFPVTLSLQAAGDLLNQAHIAYVDSAAFAPNLERFNQVRLDYGMRSFLNTVEKLLNPFMMPTAIVGIFHYPVMQRVIETIKQLGYSRGLAVQGSEGSIEALTSRRTPILEFSLDGDTLQEWAVDPHSFNGWETAPSDGSLTAENQAALTLQILDPASIIAFYYRQSAILSAGLMLYSASLSSTLGEGVVQAQVALETGKAQQHLLGMKKESHYA
jgi:anthranilate phosphoribosyltransferase